MDKQAGRLFSLKCVNLVKLPHYIQPEGDLAVLEGKNIPFNIIRIFWVRANAGETRGRHAHKKCAQFLVCSNGSIKVKCSDGDTETNFTLDQPNLGLYVPPGIWAEQAYEESHSVLTVACDRPYEEEDYIYDFMSCKLFRSKMDYDARQ